MTTEKTTTETTKTETATEKTATKKTSALALINFLPKLRSFLVLLMAVAVLLISVGFLYVHRQQQTDIETLQVQLEEQYTQVESLNKTLLEQSAQIAAQSKTISDIAAQLGSGKQSGAIKRYRINDSKYFMQLAIQALMFEHNPQKAALLLGSAHENLALLNDNTFNEVSAQLTTDITALNAVKTVDVNDIYTKLNTLIAQTENLSVTPVLKFSPDDNSEKLPAEAPTGSKILNWLGQYIKIKKHTESITPLLTPEEAVYVKHNIIVLLEQSQWGLLRREPLAYQTGLERAEKLVQQYAAKNNEANNDFVESITQLKTVDVAPVLPDISKSLPLLENAAAATESSDTP